MTKQQLDRFDRDRDPDILVLKYALGLAIIILIVSLWKVYVAM